MHITYRTKMLKRVFRIRRDKNETFPNAADRLVLNYPAAIVEIFCSWCT